MSFRDLGNTTKVLKSLLELNVPEISGTTPQVTPEPPDKAFGSESQLPNQLNVISLYLFHVAEDPYFKNAPGREDGPRSTETNPVALSLFFIVTTGHNSPSIDDFLTAQNLMGWVVKSFHDFSIVDKDTTVNGTNVATDAGVTLGDDDRLQIILRPTSPEDSVTFWSSDENPLRLSSYYEVRIVFLDPEPPETAPGLVLSIGDFVTPSVPTLSASRSVIPFDFLGDAGDPRTIAAVPAKVAVFPVPGVLPDPEDLPEMDEDPPPINRLFLQGGGLQAKETWLAIRGPGTGGRRVRIDPNQGDNFIWNVLTSGTRITTEVYETVTDEDGSTTHTIVPGSYGASAVVRRETKTNEGEILVLDTGSNEVPFTIRPEIKDASIAAGVLSVEVEGAYLLDDAVDEIQIVVAGVVYQRNDAGPAEGEFKVMDGSNIDVDLTAAQEAGGQTHSLRVVVNAADAQPYWFSTP